MVAENENQCWISWAPDEIAINDLALFTSYLADVHIEAVEYLTTQHEYQLPPGETIPYPQVARMGKASPLVVELVSYSETGGLGLLALGMLGYLVRHPEAVGGWLSRARVASYVGRKDALEAKESYLQAKARIESGGRAIDTFEHYIETGEIRGLG
jgi:hypothetical protein